MKKKNEDVSALVALVGTLLAREASGGVDERIAADAEVTAAFFAIGKPLRARVYTALAGAKRRIGKEARERIELVKGA